MPLRDHFRPPISTSSSWEGIHGMWPAMIVQQLCRIMPAEFTAEPRAHLGTFFEIDVSADEDDEPKRQPWSDAADSGGGVATATWAPPWPTMTADGELDDQYDRPSVRRQLSTDLRRHLPPRPPSRHVIAVGNVGLPSRGRRKTPDLTALAGRRPGDRARP